jgi:hypothetical protein
MTDRIATDILTPSILTVAHSLLYLDRKGLPRALLHYVALEHLIIHLRYKTINSVSFESMRIPQHEENDWNGRLELSTNQIYVCLSLSAGREKGRRVEGLGSFAELCIRNRHKMRLGVHKRLICFWGWTSLREAGMQIPFRCVIWLVWHHIP